MTDRSEAFEGVQLGLEAALTPGVAVPANKRLLGTGISSGIQNEAQEFGPRGNKYMTVVLNNKEWSAGSIDGVGSFTDIMYLLSGAFGNPVTTTPTNGVLTRRHVWTPKAWTKDAGRTFTMETGSDIRAERVTNMLIQSLGMNLGRGGITMNGAILAKQLQDGITITPTPTDLDLVPMPAAGVNVYLDDDFADLGTTQELRAMEGSWAFNDKQSVFWPMNRSNPSFGGYVESKPTAEASISLGADAAGMEPLDLMRSNGTGFLRFDIRGDLIESVTPDYFYSLHVDLAVKVLSGGDKGNSDGLLTQPWNFRIVYDGDWDALAKFTLDTTLVAL